MRDRSAGKKYFQASWYYIEIDEVDLAKDTYCYACELEGSSIEKVKNQIEQHLFVDHEILIYGIGNWGKMIYRMLEMLGFKNIIFVVTHVQQAENTFYGMPIREIRELHSYTENLLIIASSDYYSEMEVTAREEGFNHIVSYTMVKNMIFGRKD